MDEDVAELGRLIAQQQARMDRAVSLATEPAVKAKLVEIAEGFRAASVDVMASARQKAAETAAALAAWNAPADAAAEPAAAAAPEEPAHAPDLLDAYLKARWFSSFGHHAHPAEW